MVRALLAAGCLALLACKPAPLPGESDDDRAGRSGSQSTTEVEETPLFAVEDRLVTLEELELRLQIASHGARLRGETAAGRELFMTNLIRLEMFAYAAEHEGLGSSPFVAPLTADAIARARLLAEGRDGTTVDALPEGAVEAEMPSVWERPELRRGIVSVAASEPEAVALVEDLRATLAMELTTPDRAMRRWLADHCQDADVLAVEGDLGWISASNPSVNAALRDALFGLEEVGQVTDPVATARGWEFVLWTSGRPARSWDQDALRGYYGDRALARHQATRQVEALERWRSDHDVVRHDDLVAQLEAARDAERPWEVTERGNRPRRFSVDGLASAREMLLGYDVVAELEALDFDALHTELAVVGPAPTPVPPPSAPLEPDAQAPPGP